MNLFDLFENREPHQQAIDRLEARRIDDLNMKMLDLLDRAKSATPEMKAAIKAEFQKIKAERDSYFGIDPATGMDPTGSIGTTTGALGEEGPIRRLKKLVKGGRSNVEKTLMKSIQLEDEIDEASDTVKLGPDGKPEAWSHEGDWEKTKKRNGKEVDPRGEVTHMSDVERRRAEKLSQVKEWKNSSPNEPEQDNLEVVGEHGGGVNAMKQYVSWRKKANTERGINKSPPPVGRPAPAGRSVPTGSVKKKLDLSKGVIPTTEDDSVVDQDNNPKDPYHTNYYGGLDEGFQDFNKVEPYAVCLAGKPVKKFDYYEDARRFHDNWKKKLYREGDKEKADKITLMPLNLDEVAVGGSGQRVFRNGKWVDPKTTKPVKEGNPNSDPWYVFAKQNPKNFKKFKTYEAAKAYAEKHGLSCASAGYFHDKVNVNEVEDTNYTYSVFIDGNKVGTYGSKEEAKAVVRRKKEQAPGREYRIAPKPRTSMRSIKKFQRSHDVDEESMSSAAHNPTGPKFGGYYKGDQKGPPRPGQSFGGAEESKENPMNHDDLEQLIAQAKTKHCEPDPDMHRGDDHEIYSDERKIKEHGGGGGGPRQWHAYVRSHRTNEDRITEGRYDEGAVESAILKRMMVAHKNVLKEYGPTKVLDMVRNFTYQLGPEREVSDRDINEWTNLILQDLGAV